MITRYFTFGMAHAYSQGLASITAASHEECRRIAHRAFGGQWAFEYESPAEAGSERWALRPVEVCTTCERPITYPWGVEPEFMARFWAKIPRGICEQNGQCEPMKFMDDAMIEVVL